MVSPGAELRAAAKAMQAATKKSLRTSGNLLRPKLLRSAQSSTGADLLFSGARRRPLAVTVAVKQGGNTTTLTVKPTSNTSAQWRWAVDGTRAGRRRARRGRTRYTMQHPGTRGRSDWERTVDNELAAVLDRLQDDIARSVN